MMKLPKVYLRSGKDKSVKRNHPWVFSGAIKDIRQNDESVQLDEGTLVEVCDKKGRFLGIGHYHGGNIAVKILSFDEVDVDRNFWLQRISSAHKLRQKLGLIHNPETNAYRLVFAEGDQLPGLIIDIYARTAVIQTSSMGMYLELDMIKEVLLELYKDEIDLIYVKSSGVLKSDKVKDHVLYDTGNDAKPVVLENGMKFQIDWEGGQKTGFFVDQRDNRALVKLLSKDKHVLNTFCYTGGFSIAAYQGDAASVTSVDSSKLAIEQCMDNLTLNGFSADNCVVEDTLQFLKSSTKAYDLIILDPPAYAKNMKAKHNAVQGYKRLNAEAIKMIAPGGLLFTFSCSGVISRGLFENTIIAAAISVGRSARVLYHLSQPADHPINIYHQEGEYLKGLVLEID